MNRGLSNAGGFDFLVASKLAATGRPALTDTILLIRPFASHNPSYVNPFVRGIPAQGGWRFSSYVAAPSAIPKSVALHRRKPVKNGGHQISVFDEIRLPRSTAFVGPKTTKPPVGQTGGGVSPRARSSGLGGKLTRGEFMRRTGSVQRGYAQGGRGSRRIIKAGDSVGNRQD